MHWLTISRISPAFSMSVPLKMRRGRKHSIANWWRTWITKKGSIPASKCRWTRERPRRAMDL